MSVEWRPFRPEDLRRIVVQPEQASELDLARPDIAQVLAGELAFSAWVGEECVACGGVLRIHVSRAFMWAYLSRSARPHMLDLTRFTQRIADDYPARRLEVTIKPEFRAANRWVQMMGFELEAELEAYDELGRNMLLYKRIRR